MLRGTISTNHKESSETQSGIAFFSLNPPEVKNRPNSSRSILSPYWKPNFSNLSVSARQGAGVGQRIFIGQEYDEEQGLNYFINRYYKADRGQFLSQDPVFWEVGITKDGKIALADPQLQNSYSYAADNPITKKDPDGRAVYLAASPVVGNYQHLYYYVSPESGSRFSSVGTFTLGAGPQVWGGFGDLKTNVGFDSSNSNFKNGLSGASAYTQVTPQQGQSEDAMIMSLYKGHMAVTNADVSYRRFGNQSGQNNGNSNNYARTLAQYGGILGQFNSFTSQMSAPGSSRGVPLGSAGSMGIGNTQGKFVGTFDFGSAGTYNFGTQSWASTPQKSK